MSKDRADPHFQDLSIPEKILHVQDLWDEIASSQEEVELTPAQVAEAERRIQNHERDPQPTTSWETLRRRLEDSG